YHSLEIRQPVGLRLLAKPTEAALKAFERRTKVKLPQSYRCFIKVFGPGELAYEYRFLAPGYPKHPDYIDMVKFNEDTKKRLTKDVLKSYRDPERIERLLFFCRT